MAEFVVSQQHKYHFNCIGQVKEILPPNKAVLHFKLNGITEKVILLSKMLSIDGKLIEENRPLHDVIKIGDFIQFDCHVYDKGGIGSGKDRCNFFAMRASRNIPDLNSGTNASGGLLCVTPSGGGFSDHSAKMGTGWISELNPRKGVLTFNDNGRDERVVFLASGVYIFEKRVGTKQQLTDFLSEGDPVQFEAVPQEARIGSENGCSSAKKDVSSSDYCSWFATLVWKGKRPQIVPTRNHSKRRGSCDSTSSSECNGEGQVSPTTRQRLGNPDVIKGVGMIAKIVNDKAGVIWWVKSFNQLQSVWFTINRTFLFGRNLADKDLTGIFREGDPVTFLAERPTSNCPTRWIAKQVLIAEDTAALLQKAMEPPGGVKTDGVAPPTKP